jgi:hypothetical protein
VVAVNGAGGALHEVQAQAQVALEWLARRQPPRHGGQALQKRVDGLAVGRLPQCVNGGRNGGQRVFAQRAGHGGPLGQEHEQRLHAAAHLAQKARVLQIGIHAIGREHAAGLGHARLEHPVHLRKAGVQLRAPGLELLLLRGCLGQRHGLLGKAGFIGLHQGPLSHSKNRAVNHHP